MFNKGSGREDRALLLSTRRQDMQGKRRHTTKESTERAGFRSTKELRRQEMSAGDILESNGKSDTLRNMGRTYFFDFRL